MIKRYGGGLFGSLDRRAFLALRKQFDPDGHPDRVPWLWSRHRVITRHVTERGPDHGP